MRIYLIRHTRPAVADGVCYGHSDLGLADSFESEVEQVKSRLPERETPQVVYSSPLSRCLNLAAALAGDRVRTDHRLREMSFGDWEMKRWDDIDRPELDAWASDFVECPPPGGESLGTLYRRVSWWLDDLRQSPCHSATVVTHAGVIRCFYVYVSGTPLSDMFEFSVDYGEVMQIDLPPGDGDSSIVRL